MCVKLDKMILKCTKILSYQYNGISDYYTAYYTSYSIFLLIKIERNKRLVKMKRVGDED